MPEQALATLKKIISTSEIEAFLLNHDLSSTLSLLTSPLLLTNSTTTQTSAKTTDRSSNLLSSDSNSTTLYIPAFSIDNTTLGLAICVTDTQSPHEFLTPSRTLSLSRFSRSGNSMVTANDDAITMTTLHSSRRKTTTVMTLSHPAENLDLLASLTSVSKAEYARKCPCNTPTCRCLPTAKSPNHALDFSKERFNTGLYMGGYHGAAVLQYIHQGVLHLHANLKVQEFSTLVKTNKQLVEEGVMEVLSRRSNLTIKPMSFTKRELEETDKLLEKLVGVEQWEDETFENVVGRRERNRYAAARSNRKRQFRNRWLRVGVVVYRLRKQKLRGLERTLRRERFWLQERCRRELGLG